MHNKIRNFNQNLFKISSELKFKNIMKFQRINNRKPMTTEKKSEKQNNDDEMVKFVRKKYTFNIKKPELGKREIMSYSGPAGS